MDVCAGVSQETGHLQVSLPKHVTPGCSVNGALGPVEQGPGTISHHSHFIIAILSLEWTWHSSKSKI